jgi:nucleotide-binding universal stress UspA family protein
MPFSNLLLTFAVICSATSALNATIYSATRASYALGRDRMLPAAVASISSKRKTPWVALLLTGLIVIIVAVFLPTMHVASSASIMFLFLFFLVNLCVIRIRWNMGDELSYGFVMPFFPLFPIIAIILQAILAVGLGHVSRVAWIVAPVWIFAGLLIYRFYARARAVRSESEITVLEEEPAPADDRHRVMIGVANPDTVLPLVRNTYQLCMAKDARVELLHMVPVPDQVPLSDAEEFMLEGKEGIVEAMLYFSAPFPVSTTIRYCRNIARGVISAVKEKHIETLILGWQGQTRSRHFLFGSTIDPVIERAPANVVIMKNCGDQTYQHVLVPVAGGRNGAFAIEMAHILAAGAHPQITALYVDNGHKDFSLDTFVDEQREQLQLPAGQLRARTVSGTNVADVILRESKEYDLIVLGCTEQSKLYRFIHESIPERIARKSEQPLVMVKASGGFRSWIKRWI